jgi:glutamate dehydrogenase (NAD(P)+)
VVTGKPLELGGSEGRRNATGNGVVYATERYLEQGGIDGLTSLDGASVAIQGFGNVGQAAAQMFHAAGARIVALSDSSGGITSNGGAGIDPTAALAHKAEHGSVLGLPDTRSITNEELLAGECDILVPAALGNQIHADNSSQVKARLVVEAANGPLTPTADLDLAARGIPVLPDILVNAGGVLVSYFEWVQNNQNDQWDGDYIEQKLRRKLQMAVDAVLARNRGLCKTCDVEDVTGTLLRTSALALAVERVARATLQRGIWP